MGQYWDANGTRAEKCRGGTGCVVRERRMTPFSGCLIKYSMLSCSVSVFLLDTPRNGTMWHASCNKKGKTQVERNIAEPIHIRGDIMSATILTKQQSQVGASDKTKTSVSTEIDKVIIGSVAAFTGIVGLWSFACLMSAMYQAGGPFNLAGSYIRAFTGM